eukprot:GFYU01023721.1.p1 GENE.GFYU01023721.1~~GFYU01023721.1.p1  ORF type:complete len:329 (-),score=69.97 GFYU01023721.1:20-1006(-)
MYATTSLNKTLALVVCVLVAATLCSAGSPSVQFRGVTVSATWPSSEREHESTSASASSVKVAMAQIMILASDREGNMIRINNAAAKAAAQGAEIVVFPEMSIYGWINPGVFNTSQPIPGKDSDALAQIAIKHGVMIACGLAERDPVETSHVYDSAVLIDRDGTIVSKHRKVHILADLMTPAYTPGPLDTSNIFAVDTRLGRIGLLICADTMPWSDHGQVLELMQKAQPQLVIVPYGIVAPFDHWPAHGGDFVNIVKETARNVTASVVGVDSVGQVLDGPWRGQTVGGFSTAVTPVSAGDAASTEIRVLAVAADRDVDLTIVDVPLPVK